MHVHRHRHRNTHTHTAQSCSHMSAYTIFIEECTTEVIPIEVMKSTQ